MIKKRLNLGGVYMFELALCQQVKRTVLKNLLSFAFICHCSFVLAEPAEILVGMSGDMSGASADIGLEMKRGLELGFAEINASGGVQGRKVRLLALDDGYVSLLAAKNIRKLISKENVLAILGSVGTPMAMLTVPIVSNSRTLMFAPFTGASMLRKDDIGCCVYNYRASYKQEIGLMVEHILSSGIKLSEVALLSQKDASGDTAYNVAIDNFKEYGYEHGSELLHVRYRNNTLNVEQAVADVLMANPTPKAMIMISTYGASEVFIRLLKDALPDIKYYHISYTGNESLSRLLPRDTKNIYISSVVPPMESDDPVVKAYRSVYEKHHDKQTLSTVSLEGYIASKIFIELLESIKGEINRATVLEAIGHLGQLETRVEGEILYLDEKERQASQTVWLQEFVNGKFQHLSVKKY